MDSTPDQPVVLRTYPPPQLLRWNREQFMRCGSLIRFNGCRPFLLNGVLWDYGPMSPAHAAGIRCVEVELFRVFETSLNVRNQSPLDAGLDTMPVPDLAVVLFRRDEYSKRHPTGREALLVVEVADNSQEVDLGIKAELYANVGVAEYWVVDVANRVLHVLCDPGPLAANGTAYRDVRTLQPADSVAPLAAPSATVSVADLLP